MKPSETPFLLLDENRCRTNIGRMAEKIHKAGIRFRPHFKTHQSSEIGNWFIDYGVTSITVSSVKMAEYFAKDGWNDITLAFPVIPSDIERLNALAKSIQLNLLISDTYFLEHFSHYLHPSIHWYIEVDTGLHRSGFSPEFLLQNARVLELVYSNFQNNLKGFLSHEGQTYSALSIGEIERYNWQATAEMQKLVDYFQPHFSQRLEISRGDTPSCSLLSNFTNTHELRPGNFVFYDIMQQNLGSCSFNEIAVVLVCQVAAVYPKLNKAIIHAGAIHLSKEYVLDQENRKIFGIPVILDNNQWQSIMEDCFLSSLSQEHGVLTVSNYWANRLQPGDYLGILPVHSCLTAAIASYYLTCQNKILGKMRI